MKVIALEDKVDLSLFFIYKTVILLTFKFIKNDQSVEILCGENNKKKEHAFTFPPLFFFSFSFFKKMTIKAIIFDLGKSFYRNFSL